MASPTLTTLLVFCISSAATTYASKMPISKVKDLRGGVSDRESESCNGDDAADPTMPFVKQDGELLEEELPISNSLVTADGRHVHLRPLHEELQLTYVHGLISSEEIDDMMRLATARDGWGRSPLKTQQSGADSDAVHARNSSSCPLLWPLVYSSRIAELETAGRQDLIEELDLVTRITERVSDVFTQTGLELTKASIEPLQLVRYQASEVFTPHHDYHEPGPDGKLGSSVQGEQRAFTVLLFGSTLPADAGGETHFPHLGLAVTPRKGDAIVWANVDGDGEINPRSLHEGRPPADGFAKVAVNVWIADKPFAVDGRMDNAVRMGT